MAEHDAGAPPPAIVAFAPRERARDALRKGWPRRRGRVTLVRSRDEALEAIQAAFTDAVLVDLAQPTDEHWAVAALAREFPSLPFVALAPVRAVEVPHLARALVDLEFADVITEGVEDALLRDLVLPLTFTSRFADAVADADTAVGLTSALQRTVWRLVVAQGGRAVRTETLAAAVGLTREHLSRRFSIDGAPNLKRVIDLARLLAAADLAKNPGFDLPDVARVLGFASASHLSSSCQRLIGVRSSSLARLRPADLIERCVRQGRGRSRVRA